MKPFQLVLTNALLLAPEGAAARPGDLGVRGGRIAALTPTGGLKGERAERIVDLRGALVIPGFWDSHLHLAEGARALYEINLRYCPDPESFARLLREAASAEKPGEILLGQGWEEERVLAPVSQSRGDGGGAGAGGKGPTRQVLDCLIDDRPVILIRLDGHSAWLNTRALEELGLRGLACPPGQLPREEDGTPVGIVYEEAVMAVMSLVRRRLPPGRQREMIRRAAQAFNAAGITSINDICTRYPERWRLYREMQRAGELNLRIRASAYGPRLLSRLAFRALRPFGTDQLGQGPDKYFLDGSFGSRTAALREPFADRPGNAGLLAYADAEVAALAGRAVRARRPTAWHAIGDRALAQLLEAYERAGPAGEQRHRVEHIQYVRPDDITRFRRLGLVASFQPVFLYERGLTLACLGEQRLTGAYRFGSFLAAGIPVLFNTDFPYGGGRYPVKPDGAPYQGFEPLLGIHAAVAMHHNPAERVTVAEALRAYTGAPAWANFAEGELGAIKPGYRADLAVLDRNILDQPAEELLAMRVILTALDGEVVFDS